MCFIDDLLQESRVYKMRFLSPTVRALFRPFAEITSNYEYRICLPRWTWIGRSLLTGELAPLWFFNEVKQRENNHDSEKDKERALYQHLNKWANLGRFVRIIYARDLDIQLMVGHFFPVFIHDLWHHIWCGVRFCMKTKCSCLQKHGSERHR